MFFSLEELIVTENSDLHVLINKRVSAFACKSGKIPTIAFVSVDVLERAYIDLKYKGPFQNAAGISVLYYYSHFGPIEFRVKPYVKNFLMIGDEETFTDFNYNYGLPRECWSENNPNWVHEYFEKEVLT